MTRRVTDLWTGYERRVGQWYAMYCNVDLDETERDQRDDLVWVRNSEIATFRAEIAALRGQLKAIAGHVLDAGGSTSGEYDDGVSVAREVVLTFTVLRERLKAVCEAGDDLLFANRTVEIPANDEWRKRRRGLEDAIAAARTAIAMLRGKP